MALLRESRPSDIYLLLLLLYVCKFKMSADTSTRCECRFLGCAGWVSRRCEAQPQVCKNAGCECAFHSSGSGSRKRGKHSQASRHSYFVSQDAASYNVIVQMLPMILLLHLRPPWLTQKQQALAASVHQAGNVRAEETASSASASDSAPGSPWGSAPGSASASDSESLFEVVD